MASRQDKAAEFRFPVKGWHTNSARQDQPPLTTADCLNVLPFDLDRRARGAKRPGFEILTGGTIGVVTTTYRQAKLCGSEVATGMFVSTLEIGSYPYFFGWQDEQCYTVLGTDPAVENPVGTIVPSTQRVPHDDCAACTDVTPPPPPPVPYRRLRRCVDNVFSAYYIAMADVPTLPNAFKRAGDGICYRVQASDPIVTTPGDLIGTHTTFATCVVCLDDGGGGGTDNYYQFLECSDDSPSVYWIKVDDVADLPFYVRLPDSDHVLYVPEGATPGTEPGYILTPRSVPPDFYSAGSCTAGCGKGYMGSLLPASATATLSGVLLMSCMAVAVPGFGTAHAWALGYVDGSFELPFVGSEGDDCVYLSDLQTTASAFCCYEFQGIPCESCAGGGTIYDPLDTGFRVELRVRKVGVGRWRWRVRTVVTSGASLDGTWFEGESGDLKSFLAEEVGGTVGFANSNAAWVITGCGASDSKYGKSGTATVTFS